MSDQSFSSLALHQYIIGTVKRTMAHPTLPMNDPLMRLERAWGLQEEVGEVVGVLKKHICHGRPLDRQKLLNELGDVCWYATATVIDFCGEHDAQSVWLSADVMLWDDFYQNLFGGMSLAQIVDRLICDANDVREWVEPASNSSPIVDYDVQIANSVKHLLITLMAMMRRLPRDGGENWATVEKTWKANTAKLDARHQNGFNPNWKKEAQAGLIEAAKGMIDAHISEGVIQRSAVEVLNEAIERAEKANG